MNNPLISIIIPHYNSIEGAIRLLKTIPEDECLEVILVDDKSSVDLFSLREAVDTRFNTKIYPNTGDGKGAGVARNIGLSHAKGKWLLFADSDDVFVGDWLSVVLPYCNSEADIIYFPPISENVITGKIGSRHHHYEQIIRDYIESSSKKNETALRYGFYTPWSKMYRHSLLIKNQILFDDCMVCNDVMAMTKCAYHAKIIAVDSRTIYCVSTGGQTLTTQRSEVNFNNRVDIKIKRYLYLKDHLSKDYFRWTHADFYMAGSLVDALLSSWGWAKFIEVMRKYRENGVPWFSLDMINPSFIKKHLISDLKWRKELHG